MCFPGPRVWKQVGDVQASPRNQIEFGLIATDPSNKSLPVNGRCCTHQASKNAQEHSDHAATTPRSLSGDRRHTWNTTWSQSLSWDLNSAWRQEQCGWWTNFVEREGGREGGGRGKESPVQEVHWRRQDQGLIVRVIMVSVSSM